MPSRPRRSLATLSLPVLLGALLSLAPRASRADVPPSPDSPNAHCTPAEQCPSGIYCPYSNNPSKPPDPNEIAVGQECRQAAEAKGLERRCSNGGNYGGNDLYCPKGETGSWSPPGTPGAAATCGRCAMGTGAPDAPEGLWLALALGAVAIGRRRAGRPPARP